MSKHLQQLIALSKIDKDIDSFEPKINLINEELNIILNEETEVLREISRIEESIKDFGNQKSKNEIHLAELSLKLEEIEKKNKNVKTEKEMRALQLEEEITKEQLSFANDEIERFDKTIKNEKEKIEELKTRQVDLRNRIKVKEESVSKNLDDLKTEREKVFNSKTNLISQMDQKIIVFYEKIRRWAGNTTVVEVKKQACYGCFMKISDRVYSEVIKAEDITPCPHCGRILHIEPIEEA